MTNALTIYEQFDTMQRAAVQLYKSGYFKDAQDEAQAIVKVMAGAELGLPPFASMAGIHIVQGKPVLGSNVIATLVKNDPRYDYRIKQSDSDTCILEWYEHGKRVGEAGFTIKEAQAAGLTNKPTWKSYASDMLFARAISRGARRFAPGIFGGAPVYTPDEMNVDVDEDGYVEAVIIERVGEPEPEAPQSEQAVTIPMLKDLHILGKKTYGDEQWESITTDLHAQFGTSSSKEWTWDQYWEVYNVVEAASTGDA